MANRENLNPATSGTGTGTDWLTEEQYWRTNYTTRPYATADRGFDYYRPAYQYGYESANRYRGRDWNDIESEVRSGWDRFENKSQNAWENVKDAVRDAWNRATGKY